MPPANRLVPFVLIVLTWAGIYLPGLGSLEIRGEEGRRILPAVSMLQTGDFVVPRIDGVPYLRKPPLVNWLVAASFGLSGRRDETTARLPSALAILALAVGTFLGLRRSFGQEHALFAAVAVLTTVELVDKGRLIEIDALYSAAFGLALVSWIGLADGGPVRRWVVVGFFLGLGLLLKGPLLLLFFYGIVTVVAARAKSLRSLLAPAHFLGLAVMVLVFGAWLVPHLLSPDAKKAVATWSGQYAERLDWGDYRPGDTFLNFGRAVLNFLPWVLLLPFGRRRVAGNEGALVAGLEYGSLATFLVVMSLPGSLPRYTLPLAVPVAILAAGRLRAFPALTPRVLRCVFFASLALLLASFSLLFYPTGKPYVIPAAMLVLGACIWQHFEDTPGIRTLTWATSALGVAAVLCYCGKILPELQRRETLRPEAARIDAAVPPGETLYAAALDTPHVLFYLQAAHRFLPNLDAVPSDAAYLLVGGEGAATVGQRFGARAKALLDLPERGKNRSVLYRLGPVVP